MTEAHSISDLKPDKKNRRKHNQRNIGMIVDALHEVGAARSIVIDEDNLILAGNGVVEAAAEAGIERVKVVDADGETIVAVRPHAITCERCGTVWRPNRAERIEPEQENVRVAGGH